MSSLQICWKEWVDNGRGGLDEVEVCEPLAYRLEPLNDDIFPGPGPDPILRDAVVNLLGIVNAAEVLPETITSRSQLIDVATRSLESAVGDLGDRFYLKRVELA